MTQINSPALRIGILGAAKIARAFCDGVRPSPKVVVTAVASRDAAKGKAFALESGIPQVHATYESLLSDPAIDAIYNPLPNNLHAQWSIRAAEAGKHVLCEKPLATSAADARAMFEAARRHAVYLVEAYPYRAQPQTLKMRELLNAKAIGRVQLVQAAFGFPLTDAANIRMDPALAGGALMDAGCYPVSLVRTIAGERPSRVHAMAKWAPSGVDLTLAGIAGVPERPAGADFLQLRDTAPSQRVHCRRRRIDRHDLLQRYIGDVPAIARRQAWVRLGCAIRTDRDAGQQRLSCRSRVVPRLGRARLGRVDWRFAGRSRSTSR